MSWRRVRDAEPHRRVNVGGEPVPEGAEEGVEVLGVRLIGVVGIEELAEQGLNEGDLHQRGGGGTTAGNGRGEPVGPDFLRSRDRLDESRRLAQAKPRPSAERAAESRPVLLQGLPERLDEPGRPGREGRVPARRLRQLVGDDRTQLALREDPEQRQTDDQGSRPAPRHHAATRQIGQADLTRWLDTQPPADRIDRREQLRGVDPGEHRPEVTVGILGLHLEPDAAQRRDDPRPVVELVAQPPTHHGDQSAAGQQDHAAGKRDDPVETLDQPQHPVAPHEPQAAQRRRTGGRDRDVAALYRLAVVLIAWQSVCTRLPQRGQRAVPARGYSPASLRGPSHIPGTTARPKHRLQFGPSPVSAPRDPLANLDVSSPRLLALLTLHSLSPISFGEQSSPSGRKVPTVSQSGFKPNRDAGVRKTGRRV